MTAHDYILGLLSARPSPPPPPRSLSELRTELAGYFFRVRVARLCRKPAR